MVIVSATGAAATASVFELIDTYLFPHAWVLTAQVIVSAMASTVMISPTKTFTDSPSQLTGALVLDRLRLDVRTVGCPGASPT